MKNDSLPKLWISFLFIMLVQSVIAQKKSVVKPLILKEYSPGVVVKLYDFVVRTGKNVPINKQKALANFFRSSDSLLKVYIADGYSESFIDSLRQVQRNRFDSLLTKDERFNYYTNTPKSQKSASVPFSQFSLALKYKDSLGLSQNAVNALMTNIDSLKKVKDAFYERYPEKSYDSRAFESNALNNILTEEQYNTFLVIKNKNRAWNYAVNDWKEIEQRKVTDRFNKDTTLIQLANYYLARQNAYDRYAHDKMLLSTNLNMINDNKPDVLKVLMHYRRNPDNDTIGDSFKW